MGTKKKKEKRRLKQNELLSTEKILNNYKSLPENIVIKHNINNEKMSEILIDFAEPLFEYTNNDNKVYTFAMMVWNASLLPPEEAEVLLGNGLDSLCKGDKEMESVFLFLCDMLLQRKEELYPDNNRYILGYDIINKKNGKRLNVLSFDME